MLLLLLEDYKHVRHGFLTCVIPTPLKNMQVYHSDTFACFFEWQRTIVKDSYVGSNWSVSRLFWVAHDCEWENCHMACTIKFTVTFASSSHRHCHTGHPTDQLSPSVREETSSSTWASNCLCIFLHWVKEVVVPSCMPSVICSTKVWSFLYATLTSSHHHFPWHSGI